MKLDKKARSLRRLSIDEKTAFASKQHFYICSGELAEWSIAVVLKTIVPRGTGGSNPSFSADKNKKAPYCLNTGLFALGLVHISFTSEISVTAHTTIIRGVYAPRITAFNDLFK